MMVLRRARGELGCRRPEFSANSATKRRGLTLYEVLLALGIFLPAVTVLGHAISTGSRAAVQSRLQTHAVLRCESLLAEVVSGVRPMQPGSSVPFEDAPDWTWTLEVLPGPHASLVELRATVTLADRANGTRATQTLVRFARDPQAQSLSTSSPAGGGSE